MPTIDAYSISLDERNQAQLWYFMKKMDGIDKAALKMVVTTKISTRNKPFCEKWHNSPGRMKWIKKLTSIFEIEKGMDKN